MLGNAAQLVNYANVLHVKTRLHKQGKDENREEKHSSVTGGCPKSISKGKMLSRCVPDGYK